VNQIDIQKLMYFVEIVEKGSVTKAADALNMTQPPLSMAIKKMESEMDVQLFERKGKRLILTGTGQLFYLRAKELIASSEAVLQELTDHHLGLKGQITIGCSTIVNLIFIPDIIQKLNERGLEYVVNVTEGNALFILDALRNNDVDIGIIRSDFKKKDISSRELFSEPLMLALPPNHPLLEKGGPINIGDLKDEKFLMQSTTYGRNISEMIINECDSYGFYPNIVYWGSETLPVLNMVQKGIGIAFSPKSFSMIDSFTIPQMVELENSTLVSTLSLVTHNNRIKKESTNKFIEALDEVISEMRSKSNYLH